ncbi:MAG: hypothetical protein SFY56_14920 [Bacteroidota bacterium]|nr:hypothetical protein [Bacteroidota bacterium]
MKSTLNDKQRDTLNMLPYLNKRKASSISHYKIGFDYIIVRFADGQELKYSYTGKAGKYHVDNMKGHAANGFGLADYIIKNTKFLHDE